MRGTNTARFDLMSSFAAVAVFLFPASAPALEFNGIDIGAKFHEDHVRSALGVQDLKCKHYDDELVSTECTAEAEIDGLSTHVTKAVDKDGEISQVSFAVERSQFVRFEQVCMSRLGTTSTRKRSFLAVSGETWLDSWILADGSHASLMEYSSAAHGSSLLLLSKQ